MPYEVDLPCTACGSALEERTERLSAADATESDSVTVAACPDCGTRHYPEASLARVAADRLRRRGG